MTGGAIPLDCAQIFMRCASSFLFVTYRYRTVRTKNEYVITELCVPHNSQHAASAGSGCSFHDIMSAAVPMRRWTDGAWPITTAVLFVVMLICNGTAGSLNAQVSDEHRTAFTPAGYAFSIWGAIYTFGFIFCLWQLDPLKWSWQESASPSGRCRIPGSARQWFCVNFIANSLWIFAFTRNWGGNLWLSTVVIFLGVLAPLLVLHRRLDIGGPAPVTFREFVASHCFVSIYGGWLCVACIANVALAATPAGGPAPDLAGLQPSDWSIIMQVVASVVAIAMLARFRDALFAFPVAWALIAIAQQQQSNSGYPGDDRVVLCARVLGGLLFAAIAGVAVYRAAGLVAGRTRFAPEAVACWGCSRPLRVPLLGWVGAEEVAAAASRDVVVENLLRS